MDRPERRSAAFVPRVSWSPRVLPSCLEKGPFVVSCKGRPWCMKDPIMCSSLFKQEHYQKIVVEEE